MKKYLIAILSTSILIFIGAFSYRYALLASKSLGAVYSSVLVDLANTDRLEQKVNGLTLNPTLTEAAQMKANDMAENGYFAHTSPAGKTPWYWFKQVGYNFTYAGENLAVDFNDSSAVDRAWMNSPTHRANIINKNFTEIGIATAEGTYEGKSTVFVVQMFGTPAATQNKIAAKPVFETSPTTTRVLGATAYASNIDHIIASPSKITFYLYLSLICILCGILIYLIIKPNKTHKHGRQILIVLVSIAIIVGLLVFSRQMLSYNISIT